MEIFYKIFRGIAKISIISLIFMFILIGCKNSKKPSRKGIIKEIKEIKLKTPLVLQKIFKYKNYYISKDKKQDKIVLINDKGKVIKKYGTKGKGPGQFSNSYYPVDVYKGILYIHDIETEKIIKLKVMSKKTYIKYIDEFYLNEGSSYKADIKNNKIYISYTTGKYQLYVYNKEGKIVEKHFRMKEKNPFKNKEVLKKYVNAYYPLNNGYMLKAGRMSGNLVFYKKENDNYNVIKEMNVNLPDKVAERKNKPGSSNIKGIVYVENKENNYFVIPNPGETKLKLYVFNKVGGIIREYEYQSNNQRISNFSYLKKNKVVFQIYKKDEINDNIVKIGKLTKK